MTCLASLVTKKSLLWTVHRADLRDGAEAIRATQQVKEIVHTLGKVTNTSSILIHDTGCLYAMEFHIPDARAKKLQQTLDALCFQFDHGHFALSQEQ
ncbi:hypothetical protein N7535_004094 [Penicillium sp. DV-2018c]|nr:hypothetical protein N7461_000200 [Penicillium sp. DV-2018c]KAJ5577168.1 hypothetical protein N7535_004094 [Penicillium sp. DV-2018c]